MMGRATTTTRKAAGLDFTVAATGKDKNTVVH